MEVKSFILVGIAVVDYGEVADEIYSVGCYFCEFVIKRHLIRVGLR